MRRRSVVERSKLEVHGRALVGGPGPLGDAICFEVKRKDTLGGGGASGGVTLHYFQGRCFQRVALNQPLAVLVGRQDPREGDVMDTGSCGHTPTCAKFSPRFQSDRAQLSCWALRASDLLRGPAVWKALGWEPPTPVLASPSSPGHPGTPLWKLP